MGHTELLSKVQARMVLSEEHVRKEPGGRQDLRSSNSGYTCTQTVMRQGRVEGKWGCRCPESSPWDPLALTSTVQTKELWKRSDHTFLTFCRSPTSQM